MSNSITYAAAGISHLIIEELAADALVRGEDTADIEISYQGYEANEADTLIPENGVLHVRGIAAKRVRAPGGVTVTVKQARGDLRVQGVSSDVNLENVLGDLRLVDVSGVIRLAHVAADIRVEGVADLRLIGDCDGDMRVEGCESLSAEMIAGDVRLHNVGDVCLERVRGDVWMDQVRGALQVGRADGDVRLSEMHGPVVLRGISGDLRVGALLGGLSAVQVSGDAILSGPFTAPEGYQLVADGDISVSLPAEADVRLTVRARGRIRSDAPLTPTADGSPIYTSVLGRGSTRVSLTGGADVRVSHAGAKHGNAASPGSQFDDMADLRDLGDRIRQQVQASLAAAGIMTLRPEGQARSERRRPPTPERQRPASSPPASPEEQAAILKMVESGTITPEEADVLLRALGV